MHNDVRYKWRITDRVMVVREPHTVARRYGTDVCRIGHKVADLYSFGRLALVVIR